MMVLWKLLKIAGRNIFRNKRRTGLTLMILILGSSGLILLGGFFESLLDQFREAYIYSYSGHLRISRTGYNEKGTSMPFEYLLKDVNRLMDLIQEEPEISYVVPRLQFEGMLSSDTSGVSGIVLGVDPVLEHRMVSYSYPGARQSAAMITGNDLDQKDPHGIILGEGLAKSLDLRSGVNTSLITTRSSGAIDGAEFHVRGSFITPLKEVGDRVMKINLETAQSLLDASNQVHYLLIILKNTKDTQMVKNKLEKKFKSKNLDLEVVTWEEQGTLYRQSRNFLAGIHRVVQIIVSIIFFLSIANTINMALFERMREYGTMMAIGNSRLIVFSIIFFEACILGLIGSCLGILFGVGAANVIGPAGLEIPPPPITTVSIGSLNLLILIKPGLLFEAFLIGFTATIASSIIPGYRASHLRIIQALGYV